MHERSVKGITQITQSVRLRPLRKPTVCVTLSWVLFLLLLVAHLSQAQNIFPDPSFEVTGVEGMAKTGQRAGHLRVDERQHWVCIGGSLPVEPFATYRVSAWVKAKVGTGSPFALYCYAWNSFDWAFSRGVPLRDMPDWTKVEVTFVSPHDYMVVHPLGFLGAANCEAWVDDVVVEKIKGVEETMKPLLEKVELSMEEVQLLARYYVWCKQPDKAKLLMEEANDYTKADIACLLAKNTRDPKQRRRLILDMIRFGGLTYSNGFTRFEEITADLTPTEKLEVCETALMADTASKAAGNAYRSVAERCLQVWGGPFTCTDIEYQINLVEASLGRVLNRLPKQKIIEGVEAVKKSVDTARKALAQRRASLGQCIINIGGKIVSSKSHAIVIPTQPTPQEKHAAKDLQAHLELLTGQQIPIIKDKDNEVGKRNPILIVVGKSEFLKKLKVKVDWDSLGTDGILIKTVGANLVLAGGKRGVLYACYTFLEDYLRVRWLAPDCTVFHKEGTFELPRIYKRYVPALEYREPFAFCGYDADWAVRNKSNGSATRLDEARGGKVIYKGFVHTFYALVPPEKYFKQHPEYFSEIGGKRRHEHAQLCLTNPDVEDVVVEAVKRWLKESPEANIVSVSQNDWGGNCQCASCKAVDDAEGSPSGSLLRFVNRVAERIEKEFPNVAIDTLAYQYTRKPPKLTKPRHNVIVRLCSIECSFAQPLNSKQNEAFARDIEGWGKICQRLYVWDYVTNFAHYIQPHPNLRVLKPNIQFFVKNGVKGVFEQGGYQSPGGEFQELRTWLLAKLLWNPEADVRKLMKVFLEGYYGDAAPYIQQYIELMHNSVEKTNTYLGCYSPPTAPFLTPEVLMQADILFDRAEKAVQHDATLLKRVQTARLPVLYVHIVRGIQAYKEEDDKLVAVGDGKLLLEKFEKIARAAGVTHIREGAPNINEWLNNMRKQTSDLRIERLRNPELVVSILPELGGRIWRLRYLLANKDGSLSLSKDIIKLFGTEEALQPDEGGYEEYSETGYRSPGWNESYEVLERTSRSILLQADLKNGLRLSRRIEIDARKPLIRIVSTLSNPSGTARSACLRIHPTFSVADTQRASVLTKCKDGRWNRRSLANPEDPLAEKELWLRGDDRPAGEWAVVDETDDVGVISRFRLEQVGLCYLNWSGNQRRVNLELWSPAVEMKPGEKLQIEHTYEVVHPAAKLVAK